MDPLENYENAKRFYEEQEKYFKNGNYQEGLSILKPLIDRASKEELKEPNILGILAGLAIDYSQPTNQVDLANDGVHLLEIIQQYNPQIADSWEFNYNLANGYMNLNSLRVRTKKTTFNPFLDYEDLDKAKDLFEKALQKTSTPELLTNYANILDNMGRKFEAIEYYKKAKQNSPMALANMAVSIKDLANISSRLRLPLNQYAHKIILEALTKEDEIVKVGGRFALNHFQTVKKELDQYSPIKSYKRFFLLKYLKFFKKKTFSTFYSDYCLENDLFLNVWFFDKEQKEATFEDLYISMILPVEDTTTFYRLSKKLNEIKESYATARSLLILSQYKTPDVNKINGLTLYVYPNDYSISNIYIGFLKASYKECFNLLDKIALLLDDYLNLGIDGKKDISYSSFWFENQDTKKKKISSSVIGNANLQLYAIYSSMLDIYKQKDFETIRHNLTHNNLYVYSEYKTSEDLKNIGYEVLLHKTLTLFKILKRIIIYLVYYVNLTEQKKKKNFLTPPMFVDTRPMY